MTSSRLEVMKLKLMANKEGDGEKRERANARTARRREKESDRDGNKDGRKSVTRARDGWIARKKTRRGVNETTTTLGWP